MAKSIDSNHSGYKLTKEWFDFALNNPDKVSGNHTALYLWIVEINNRSSWREKFGLTVKEGMDGMSCKSRTTYSKCFQNLIEWGFIEIIKPAVNQYQCNIIALPKNVQAQDKHLNKHESSTSTDTSTILKPLNNKPKNNKTDDYLFDQFWNLYPVKIGKKDSEKKWSNLTVDQRTEIIAMLPQYIKYEQFPGWNHPNPSTFLNKDKERWKDDIATPKKHSAATVYTKPRVIDHSKL